MVKDILGGVAAAIVAGFCLGTGYKGAAKFWGKVGEWTDPRTKELKRRLEETSRLAEEQKGGKAPREEAP